MVHLMVVKAPYSTEQTMYTNFVILTIILFSNDVYNCNDLSSVLWIHLSLNIPDRNAFIQLFDFVLAFLCQ